ncbi:cellulose synthase [Nonomuraea sp. NPDC048916]|uniref:cellulose synthase n=1 Tax=Nonomuraea sp. NPDC048916 TaxID=3154232 RepID=UPI0034016DA7
MTFDQIAWLPLCAGVTIAGLVLSFLAFKRRGVTAGLRTTAWALLPLAAYLTGALQSLWTVGATLIGFVTGLVFNPLVWSGVALTGLSVVLFVVSGVLRGRQTARADGPGKAKETRRPAEGAPAPKGAAAASAGKPAVEAPKKRTNDDDFSDIEEILRRRGIG